MPLHIKDNDTLWLANRHLKTCFSVFSFIIDKFYLKSYFVTFPLHGFPS